MNFTSRKINRSVGKLFAFVLLIVGALSFAPDASAQTASAPKETPGRYLLIVDTSLSMQRNVANVQRIVGNLLYSGMNGQMRPGETVGLWTFNDELHAGDVPVQRWTPQTRQRVATEVVKFLQKQKYDKTTQFEKVLGPLLRLVKDSEKLTVVLITDGDVRISGTPFDQLITDAYRLNRDEQRKQRMPFVTILRSTDGEFSDWKVNTPPWPLEFPPATKSAEIRKTDSSPVEAETKSIAPVVEEKKLEVVTAPTTNAATAQPNAPVIGESPVKPDEKKITTGPVPTETSTVNPPVVPEPLKVDEQPVISKPEVKVVDDPPVVPPKETSVHPVESLVEKIEPESVKLNSPEPPQNSATHTQPVTARTESSTPQSQSPSATESPQLNEPDSTNQLLVQTALAPGTETIFSRYGFLAAGVALLLFAVGLIFVLLRRPRETDKVSLITHSMDKK